MAFLAAVLSNRLRIPYTLVLVLTGVVITVVASSFTLQGGSFQNLISQLRSIGAQLLQGGGGGLFVGLVVPPLIFEAMIHLRASDLRAVIKPSLALATVGVLIATSVGGLILWKGVGLSPYDSFLFAALIAPHRRGYSLGGFSAGQGSFQTTLHCSIPKRPSGQNQEDRLARSG